MAISEYNVASIIFVNPQHKLILQKRDNKPGIRNANMITVWGGACEGDESPLQAAVREVHEETNLKPSETDLEFFGKYERNYKVDDKQVVNYVYLLKNIDESQLKVFEGQGYVLVDPTNDTENPLYTELSQTLVADYGAYASS